uniref:Uncharacterized protein n=1 Tax=Anguilla anguilla TaxID=7936 RepID=A0A0E9TW38_ANGAN
MMTRYLEKEIKALLSTKMILTSN